MDGMAGAVAVLSARVASLYGRYSQIAGDGFFALRKLKNISIVNPSISIVFNIDNNSYLHYCYVIT